MNDLYSLIKQTDPVPHVQPLTDEQAAMNNYERIGHLINILQSKARRSLKGRDGSHGKTRLH